MTAKSENVVCELLLVGAAKGQHNWWTEGARLVQMDSGGPATNGGPGLRLGNCEDCSPDLARIIVKP